MVNQNDEYIPVETTADLLQLRVRLVNRYGNPPYNRLQTRKVGRHVLYHNADILALTDELGVAYFPRHVDPSSARGTTGKSLRAHRRRSGT